MGMLFILSVRPWAMASNARSAYAGVGAFNLVRTGAYRAVGGYEALRTEIIDDMRLGRAVKAAGGRSELLMGDDLLQVRWQVGVAGLINGVEKNSFAAMEFSWPYLLGFSALYLGLLAAPYVASSRAKRDRLARGPGRAQCLVRLLESARRHRRPCGFRPARRHRAVPVGAVALGRADHLARRHTLARHVLPLEFFQAGAALKHRRCWRRVYWPPMGAASGRTEPAMSRLPALLRPTPATAPAFRRS